MSYIRSIAELKFLIKHKSATKFSRVVSSSPYLSGDLFSSLADYSVPSNVENLDLSVMIRARVLFIPSHFVMKILNDHSKIMETEILIAGNSDFEFRTPEMNFPKSLKMAFLQNSFISNQINIFTLPIGIENIIHGRNGFKSTMKEESWNSKLDKVLIGPYSDTSNQRKLIVNYFRNRSGPWDVVDKNVPPFDYPKLQSKYKYVLCPGGNGIDTHRVWESIYRGSWPILERNDWSISISEKYPVILVNSLLDKDEIFNEINKPIYRHPPTLNHALYIPHWKEILEQ